MIGLLLCSLLSADQSADVVWQRVYDSGGPAWVQPGADAEVDKDGNLYALFRATSRDIVCKFDPNFKLLWETPFQARLTSLDIDAAGNVYVAGSTLYPAPYISEPYIARLTDKGERKWERQFEGPMGRWGSAIDLDATANGDVFVAAVSRSESNAYLLRFDSEGALKWARGHAGPGKIAPHRGSVRAFDDGSAVLGFSNNLALGWARFAPDGMVAKSGGLELDRYSDNVEVSVDHEGSVFFAVSSRDFYELNAVPRVIKFAGGQKPEWMVKAAAGNSNVAFQELTPDGKGGVWALGSTRNDEKTSINFASRYSGAGELQGTFSGERYGSGGMRSLAQSDGSLLLVSVASPEQVIRDSEVVTRLALLDQRAVAKWQSVLNKKRSLDLAQAILAPTEGGKAIVLDQAQPDGGESAMRITRVDLESGRVKQEARQAFTGGWSDMVIDAVLDDEGNTYIYTLSDRHLPIVRVGVLSKVDKSGERVWSVELPDLRMPGQAPNVVLDGKGALYVLGSKGKLVGSEMHLSSMVTKLTTDGKKLWQATKPGTALWPNQIAALPDGGVAVAGQSAFPTSDNLGIIYTLDKDGKEGWTANLSNPNLLQCAPTGLISGSDGTVYVSFATHGDLIQKPLVQAFDSNGKLKHVFLSGQSEFGFAMIAGWSPDGSLVITTRRSPNNGSAIVRLSPDLKSKRIDLVSEANEIRDVLVTPSGTYLTGLGVKDRNPTCLVAKIGENGLEWVKSLGEEGGSGRSILLDKDGNLLIAGTWQNTARVERSVTSMRIFTVSPKGEILSVDSDGNPQPLTFDYEHSPRYSVPLLRGNAKGAVAALGSRLDGLRGEDVWVAKLRRG